MCSRPPLPLQSDRAQEAIRGVAAYQAWRGAEARSIVRRRAVMRVAQVRVVRREVPGLCEAEEDGAVKEMSTRCVRVCVGRRLSHDFVEDGRIKRLLKWRFGLARK